jgi:uncharacterized protein YggT (Ycf19 family)
MTLIDFILNLAGVLLWLGWRSFRFDPLVKTTPATLIGTLRRAEPSRLKGWQFLAGLVALLLLRALLYRQLSSAVDWTPRLNLFFVVLAFPGDAFPSVLVYSVVSFARILVICYFWVFALVIINRRQAEKDPLHKMLRLHLGFVARWPWVVQALLPLVFITGTWMALHPLLVYLGIVGRVESAAHLLEQGLLVGVAVYLTLQYVLPVFLLLHLISSYVYLGSSPAWDFIGATAVNLLAPFRQLPLRMGRFDFSPLIGVIAILFLLHWLPNQVLGRLAENNIALWPQ